MHTIDPVMRLRTPDGPVYMPQLAVGVWELSADEVETAIAYALDAGFTHVDTANGVCRLMLRQGSPTWSRTHVYPRCPLVDTRGRVVSRACAASPPVC